MSTVLTEYGPESTLTQTLAGLTNNSARASAVIDNTTDRYLDALLQYQITTGTGAGAGSYAEIRAYASADNGTTFTDGATGSDAAITLPDPPNAPLVGIVSTPAASTTYKGSLDGVAKAFGGVLPKKWGTILVNKTASTLSATEGDHKKLWQGVYEVVEG